MKKAKDIEKAGPLDDLCASVRKLVLQGEYGSCETIIYKALQEFPHAPHPHNLLGIVLEKTGNHFLAMRHFLAALALDPSYRPANHNLDTYGTFFSHGNCAFDESDIPATETDHTESNKDAKIKGEFRKS